MKLRTKMEPMLKKEERKGYQFQLLTALPVSKSFPKMRLRSIRDLSTRPSALQNLDHRMSPSTLFVLNVFLSKQISNNLFPYSRLVKTGQLNDSNRLILQRVQYLTSLAPDRQHGVPVAFLNDKAGKKMFFPNIFMNSEEFKDLGNLHYERRKLEYVPQEDVSLHEMVKKKMQMSGTDAEFLKSLGISAGANPNKKWKMK